MCLLFEFQGVENKQLYALSSKIIFITFIGSVLLNKVALYADYKQSALPTVSLTLWSCMHACILHTQTHTHARTHAHMHARTHARVHTHVCMHAHGQTQRMRSFRFTTGIYILKHVCIETPQSTRSELKQLFLFLNFTIKNVAKENHMLKLSILNTIQLSEFLYRSCEASHFILYFY